MLSVSNEFKRQLNADNRNYLIRVSMTLADETSITLTNEDIWASGVKIEEATSSTDSFDIGSAVIGKCDITINDITQKWSTYDFFNATFVLYFGLEGDATDGGGQRYYRKGFYTVDSADYNGSLITLHGLDNMWRFDTEYSSITGLAETMTIGELVETICQQCNVTLGTPTFYGYNKTVSTSVDGELNCREVISYLAQICCCYTKIDASGELVIKWYNKDSILDITNYDGGTYNTTTTPYSDGDDVPGGRWYYDENGNYIWEDLGDYDGGTFNDLPDFAWITQNSSISVGTDDIVVTGCRVCSSDTDSDTSYDVIWADSTTELDYDRYLLVIQDNPFVTKDTADDIATDVGSILANLPLRVFSASSLNDLSYECGDPCAITDFRGNRFYSFITNLSFTTNNYETFSCGATSINENKSVRYSDNVKTLVEAKKNATQIVSDYNKAVQSMNDLASEAIGYNKYVREKDGATITYCYSGTTVDETDPDKPLFPDSANVFMISGDGVFISNDGGETYTNGYDANSGTAILNLIYATGLSADWIKAGQLFLSGNDNGMTFTAYNWYYWLENYTISSSMTVILQEFENDYSPVVDVASLSSTMTATLKLATSSSTISTETITLAVGENTFTTVIPALYYTNNGYIASVIFSGSGVVSLKGYHYAVDIRPNTIINGNRTDLYAYDFYGDVIRGGLASVGSVRTDLLSAKSSSYINVGSGTHFNSSVEFNYSVNVLKQYFQIQGSSNTIKFYPDDYNYAIITDGETKYVKWDGSSDRRVKDNITAFPIEEARQLLDGTTPVFFNYKNATDKICIGVVAQDIEPTFNDFASSHGYDNSKCVTELPNGIKTVDYEQFHGIELACIQDLYKQIDELKAQIEELKT